MSKEELNGKNDHERKTKTIIAAVYSYNPENEKFFFLEVDKDLEGEELENFVNEKIQEQLDDNNGIS